MIVRGGCCVYHGARYGAARNDVFWHLFHRFSLGDLLCRIPGECVLIRLVVAFSILGALIRCVGSGGFGSSYSCLVLMLARFNGILFMRGLCLVTGKHASHATVLTYERSYLSGCIFCELMLSMAIHPC